VRDAYAIGCSVSASNLCESTAPTPYGDVSHANTNLSGYHNVQVPYVKIAATLLYQNYPADYVPT